MLKCWGIWDSAYSWLIESMIRYWLKLWSVNHDLFDDAIRSIQDWFFDFIELYIVPGIFDKEKFEKLQDAHIDISFHLPHGAHWFNPIDPNNSSEDIWSSIHEYRAYLNPFAMVLHPEIGNDIKTLKKRLEFFHDDRILIENMPKKSSIVKDMYFYGYNGEQIRKIKEFHTRFCFDFAKAKSSAVSQWINVVDFSNQLIEIMNPEYFHISWFLKDTEADEHLDLHEWDKEFMKNMQSKLFDIATKKDIFVVFECKKNDGLKNDLKNLEYFKHINTYL